MGGRSQEGSFDQIQEEIGLGFDPTKTMGRARSRPRDRSPAGPQSHRPDTDPARRGWAGTQEPKPPLTTGRKVSHVQYIGPPSPRASPHGGVARGADPRQRGPTAADLA